MTLSDTPPQDVKAEQAILGSCMLSAHALTAALSLISDEDWYRPAHATIWQAIRRVHNQNLEVDPITVGVELAMRGEGERYGGPLYLHTLVAEVATTANITYYCEIVAAAAVRRRLIQAGTSMVQRAYEMSDRIDEVIDHAKTELDLIARTRITDGAIPGLLTWGDFIATYAGREENWIVPGLIGRKDVWMILAPPGAGKTTLSRQMCWTIAAGIHPFYGKGHEIEPKRTLLIDLENDEGMAADESVDFYARIDSLGHGVDDRGWVWSHPQGLNIRDAKDANLLDQVVGDTKPEFVALGSLYKSFSRSGDWDQAAQEARMVLDKVRNRHQVAFWLEHHMPKGGEGGTRRHTPFGSSVWEWWASHGRVLEKACDSKGSPYRFAASFRGDRRKAEMPAGFNRGVHELAWDPIWDAEEIDLQISGCA